MMTVIPKTAFAKMDFRCPPYLDPDVQFGKLRKHLDDHGFRDIELVKLSTRGNAWVTDRNEPVVQAVKRAIKTVYPDTCLSTRETADGVFRVKLGIPSCMSSFCSEPGNMHATNENCDIDYYIRWIKYASTIMAGVAY
jgi:acetylornithine deacetylase/succinyl-diaminopimelate desuccinylase-like protein